ncbi:MAG: CcdB family protein [Rhodospirillaceae bacterium]
MAKFDVYRDVGKSPYVVDVQSDIWWRLNIRMVIPLLRQNDAPTPAKGLNPSFTIEGVEYVLVTQFMAAVPTSALRNFVTTLSDYDTDIINAIDSLLCGT